MSRRDQLTELDQKIAATFQSAAEELREEIVERLQETRDRLHRLVQDTARAARVEPESRTANSDLANLRTATGNLVAAATQEEILDRLLSGATRFAERAALFLVDDSSARVWAHQGFTAEIDNLDVPTEDERWSRLVRQQGVMRLSADDCGHAFGGRIDGPPNGGVLIPMGLADRLVGALYADGPEELAVEPLQLLVQSASHCLESLSLRPKRLPIALRMAADAGDHGTRLELWSADSTHSDNEEE